LPQKLRGLWKDHWPIFALLATALVIVVTGVLRIWRSWERPFWDWLGLLIIPVLLGLGGIWFNSQTRKSEQALAQEERKNSLKIAEDRVREDALQRYLDRMSELVLDKNLRKSKRDDAVRATARARTLTVLRSLDGYRKGQVVRFLHEADLIGRVVMVESGELRAQEAIIDLEAANLSNADLSRADLSGTRLSNADLSSANLNGARLTFAKLSHANLLDADLSFANLLDADLSFADLRGATLFLPELHNADLSFANLESADLGGGDLTDDFMIAFDYSLLDTVNLRGANLRGAKGLTNKKLARAESLVEATLPDGTEMTEEAWEEFKKHYRQ
jgi:uncharacterized protein YjbI with pentapeptide repeats